MPGIDTIRSLLERSRTLGGAKTITSGAVIYWMSREIRSEDNYALLYAQEVAITNKQPLYVIYNLDVGFLGGGLRQHVFKIGGLKVVAENFKKLDIPFFISHQNFTKELNSLIDTTKATVLVTDFNPLKINDTWIKDVNDSIVKKKQTLCFHQVDAHNVVPCWVTSNKCEFGARTIRPKLHKLMPEYLLDIPKTKKHPFPGKKSAMSAPEWSKLLDEKFLKSRSLDSDVKPVSWVKPGEDNAKIALKTFVRTMSGYGTKRNDPNANALSNLSPYFHYGMLSPQRAIYMVKQATSIPKADRDSFIEETFVRRELSDNFCHYNKNYDNPKGFHEWAQKTLNQHKNDKREHLYSLKQLEESQTHDPLWNAAQKEMVVTGKMHGFMRMYWAKKCLEWTQSPDQALKFAIHLNDKYSLDGRDPNGYVGCAWSIGGVHDRAWEERKIFGKIRYMTYDGCKGKFNINDYMGKFGFKAAPKPGAKAKAGAKSGSSGPASKSLLDFMGGNASSSNMKATSSSSMKMGGSPMKMASSMKSPRKSRSRSSSPASKKRKTG